MNYAPHVFGIADGILTVEVDSGGMDHDGRLEQVIYR